MTHNDRASSHFLRYARLLPDHQTTDGPSANQLIALIRLAAISAMLKLAVVDVNPSKFVIETAAREFPDNRYLPHLPVVRRADTRTGPQ